MSPDVVRVLVEGREAHLYGSGRTIYAAIRAARAWRHYDQRRRAVTVKATDLDEILAAIEFQNGGDVRIERVA